MTLTQERAHELFEYRDGQLIWKNCHYAKLNGVQAGYPDGNGYRKLTIDRKQYFEHRVIFLMQHGYCPELIDHIDQNKSNNRIDNLREATRSENAMNTSVSRARLLASVGASNVAGEQA